MVVVSEKGWATWARATLPIFLTLHQGTNLYSNLLHLDLNYDACISIDLLFCYRIVFGLVSAKREDLFEFAIHN